MIFPAAGEPIVLPDAAILTPQNCATHVAPPAASGPMKLPSTWFALAPFSISIPVLPAWAEMIFRSAGAAPPIKLPIPPEMRSPALLLLHRQFPATTQLELVISIASLENPVMRKPRTTKLG